MSRPNVGDFKSRPSGVFNDCKVSNCLIVLFLNNGCYPIIGIIKIAQYIPYFAESIGI